MKTYFCFFLEGAGHFDGASRVKSLSPLKAETEEAFKS